MAKKKSNPELFRIEDQGKTADGKQSLYCGFVGGRDIGCVTAPSKAAGRQKLLRIARQLLK